MPGGLFWLQSLSSNPPPAGGGGLTYAQHVATLSPTAYWRCGDASGSLTDSSGNGYDLTNVVGSTTYGVTGWTGDGDDAIQFDAAGDYFRQADANWMDVGTSDWSFSWVAKMSSWPGASDIVAHDGGGTPGEWAVQYGGTTDQIAIRTGATYTLISSVSLADGDWHHCVVAVDRSGSATLYVDGSSAGTVDVSASVSSDLTNTSNIWVGYDLVAYIDEMVFWNNRLISSSEALAMYNAQNGTGGGGGGGGTPTQADTYAAEVATQSPVAYYKLNEGSGTTATDSSPSANHASFVGSPTLGVAGPFDGATAATFDDVAEYVIASGTTALDFSASDDFSLVVWIKIATWNGGWIIAREGSGSYDDYELYCVGATTDKLSMRLIDAAETSVLDVDSATTSALDDDAWHMVALAVDRNGNAQYYLDGSSYGSAIDVSGHQHELEGSGKDFFIARKGTANGELAATICQVSVHDKLLSSGDVSDLWTAAGN